MTFDEYEAKARRALELKKERLQFAKHERQLEILLRTMGDYFTGNGDYENLFKQYLQDILTTIHSEQVMRQITLRQAEKELQMPEVLALFEDDEELEPIYKFKEV